MSMEEQTMEQARHENHGSADDDEDLDVNVHPPPLIDHPALHLALGIPQQEDLDPPPPSDSSAAQAPRQNFSRFDPGMSEMTGQRDEISELITTFDRDPSEITPTMNLGDGSLDESFRVLCRSDDSIRALYDDFGYSSVFPALQSASGTSDLVDSSAEMEGIIQGDDARKRSYLPRYEAKRSSGFCDTNARKSFNFYNSDARRSTDSIHTKNSLKYQDESSRHQKLGHRASNDCVLGRSFGSSLGNERLRSSLINGRRSWGSSRRLSESSVSNERRILESSLLNDRGSLESSPINARGSSASSLINERQSLEDSLMNEIQSLKSSFLNERNLTEATLMQKRQLSGPSLVKDQQSSGSASLTNDLPPREFNNPTSLLLRNRRTSQRITPSTIMPMEYMSQSTNLGATNDDYNDNDDDALLSERSRRLNRSALHWGTARTRLSSVLTRSQSQHLALDNAPRTQLGIQRISRMSTNEESAASKLARQFVDDHIGTLSNLDENKKEEDVKDNVDGNVGLEFECNICLEMASEPVVTCCGHLFCWPCLHQWLHVHSVAKKCPVCKGLLSDEAIIPIYGRGSFVASESSSQGRNIPPRPSARRVSRKRVHWENSIHSDVRTPRSANEIISDGVDESLDESNTTDVILERLRVAQTLQQEFFERRSTRLAQRLMSRQNPHFDSPSIPRTRELHQRARQTLETAADNLAAIQTSIDGLRENMQRLVEFVRSVPRYNSSTPVRSIPANDVRQNVLDDERVLLPQTDVHEVPLHVIIPSIHPFGNVDGQSSLELQENHENTASVSHNGEAGLFKRCRLN